MKKKRVWGLRSEENRGGVFAEEKGPQGIILNYGGRKCDV